jgi:hypothetical protein
MSRKIALLALAALLVSVSAKEHVLKLGSDYEEQVRTPQAPGQPWLDSLSQHASPGPRVPVRTGHSIPDAVRCRSRTARCTSSSSLR